MAKSKQKHHPNKSNSTPDFEECVQDGWVIVKKQKVTILIPPLPIAQQSPIPSPSPSPNPNPNPNPGGTPSPPIPTQEADHIITDPPLPLVTTKTITTLRKSTHRGKFVKSHNKSPKPRKYCGNLVNGHMLVNTKMRALNLERKLKRAGGLNSWLVSLGLGQFVKIFRCKRVGKVQLVNLSMKKLKDMGVIAVGPRRKLMHAIDCLW